MPKSTTVIFAKHLLLDGYKVPPTDFARQKLAPLVEGRRGSPLHVMHNVGAPITVQSVFKKNFDVLTRDHKLMARWSSENRDWLRAARKEMAKADKGEATFTIDPEYTPEMAFILEVNKECPGTIINHISNHSMEVMLERLRGNIFLHRANATFKTPRKETNLQETAQCILEAQNALANAVLLMDNAAIEDAAKLDGDVVFLRSPAQTYILGLLEGPVRIETEGGVSRFSEEAISGLAAGTLGKTEHDRLITLEILLTLEVSLLDATWSDPEIRGKAHAKALERFDELADKVLKTG